MLSERGCFRFGYKYFETVANAAYIALENQFRCWPPQEDPEWRENADYARVRQRNEENRHRHFTIILPAEPQKLREFLRENDLDSPQKYSILDVHTADGNKMELEEILFDWRDIMSLNYFFYRYRQLPEGEKGQFVLTANAKNIVDEKELINLTANLDGLCIIDDIQSKEELGKFLVENELCFTSFDDEALPFLDYRKIAEKHMEETGGRICWGTYIEDTVPQEEHIEIYDGVNLPDFILHQDQEQEEGCEESQGFGGMVL